MPRGVSPAPGLVRRSLPLPARPVVVQRVSTGLHQRSSSGRNPLRVERIYDDDPAQLMPRIAGLMDTIPLGLAEKSLELAGKGKKQVRSTAPKAPSFNSALR